MAANYSIVAVHTTEELQGGTRLVKVRSFSVETKPSRVYFEVRLPRSLYNDAAAGVYIDGIAVGIEDLLQQPSIAGMVFVQDVDAAGQLLDLMEITVQDVSGEATDILTVKVDNLSPLIVIPLLTERVDQLNALMGL